MSINNIWLRICLEEKKQITYNIVNKYLKSLFEVMCINASSPDVECFYIIVSNRGIDDDASALFFVDRKMLKCDEIDETKLDSLKNYLLIEVISKYGI